MSSSSQSSDWGINDPIPIEFIMHRGALDTPRELGYFNLEMPLAGVTSFSRSKPEDYPLVMLEVKDQDQMDSLARMKQLQHENILGVHFFDEDKQKNCVRVYIEPYRGCLTDLIHPVFFFNQDTKMFPSQQFQWMVSVSLNALDHIIKSGLYHGNFSWNTTVYVNREDGEKILKLANFESIKDKSLLECQVADCHALGYSLDEVSLYVESECANCKPETCLFMDDLARRLKAISILEQVI